MSGCQSKNREQTCLPLKTVLRKIGDRYQTYCAAYKMHAMATHQGGAGHPIDRDINLHIEDTETTGLDNDNESTSGSDITIALGGPEAEGHPDDLIPNNQAKLTAIIREINDLHQWVEAGEGQPAESLDCIEWELQNLSLTLQPQPSSTPTPAEPFREVTCQYTYALCTTQKETNITNSLLQDTTVFNEYDSTKLEDWLKDIETAADLTNESQAKLAKAKLRRLTHTLVMEAVNSDKSWEEIKDLLWLKLCNANIQTFTSHFIDIQQQEKESLAAYIHRFKTEAKRYNFTNDSATIRIFVKGLKMPIIWQHESMKKDLKHLPTPSQMCRSLMPYSSSWQQLSYPPQLMWCHTKSIAVSCVKNQDISHDIALTLGAMNVSSMVISSWTVHTEYLLLEPWQHITNHTKVTMTDWVQGTTVKIETGKGNPDHSPTTKDITAWVIMICIGTALDHNIGTDAATTGAAYDDLASAHRGNRHRPHHDTLHQSHHWSSEHWWSLGYWSLDCSRSHSQPSYRSSRHKSCRSDSYSSRMRRRPHPKKNMKVKIEDPHTDYYSSNDHSSGSGEESDPLN